MPFVVGLAVIGALLGFAAKRDVPQPARSAAPAQEQRPIYLVGVPECEAGLAKFRRDISFFRPPGESPEHLEAMAEQLQVQLHGRPGYVARTEAELRAHGCR
jgi:hypothetical protein